MDSIAQFLDQISTYIWGPYVLIPLLLGVGVILMAGLRCMPLRRLPRAFVVMWQGRRHHPDHKGELSPFRALMTSLAATIGTGNIVGVATAILLGGPGAVFWMWVTALFGMATKFCEATLAVHYREMTPDGKYVGGPMYYIKNGLGKNWKWLAALFAVFGMVASFGIGNMTQANAIAINAISLGKDYDLLLEPAAIACLLLLLAGTVLIGGVKRIGAVSGTLVPIMAFIYVIGGLVILIVHADKVGEAFFLILDSAFSGHAAVGGFAGAALAQAIRFGVARGLFSNEAGLGSAPIAHATAIVKNPVKQGLLGMLDPFLDTIVICSISALVILSSGEWKVGLDFQLGAENANTVAVSAVLRGEAAPFDIKTPEGGLIVAKKTRFTAEHLQKMENADIRVLTAPDEFILGRLVAREIVKDGKTLAETHHKIDAELLKKLREARVSELSTTYGAGALTARAFRNTLGAAGSWLVTVGLVFFAFSTILGWCVYGERCAIYLFGHKAALPFRIFFTLIVPVGALAELNLIWNLSDLFNSLMAIPNLIALLLLSPVVFKLAREFFDNPKAQDE
ncbi:MAG: sodium:alanine symporter family protein [Zoogloeaceae bacterium]|jgi:AGCS family alanine or glycine:cation symporter|nr:sodium:alanine symporter family protein [Zoogloeaceae bacterium]